MSKEFTAYHEAAHAIVAHDCGMGVERLELLKDRDPAASNAWKGNTYPITEGHSSRCVLRFAFAGLFAAFKLSVLIDCPPGSTIVFDDCSVSEILRKILKWDPEDEKDLIGINGSVPVLIDGQQRNYGIDGDDVEGDIDALRTRGVRFDEECLRCALEWLRVWINDADNWATVKCIADTILARKPAPVDDPEISHRVVIEGNELVTLIENARSHAENRTVT